MKIYPIAIRIAGLESYFDDICIYVDLDNTLICAREKSSLDEEDFKEISDSGYEYKEVVAGKKWIVGLRPGAKSFLEAVGELGEVKLCTAATKPYANAMLRAFELTRYFSEIISRENLDSNEMKEKYPCSILVDDLPSGMPDIKSKLKVMGIPWDNSEFYRNNPNGGLLEEHKAEMAHHKNHHVNVAGFYGGIDDGDINLNEALAKVKIVLGRINRTM